MSRYLDSANTQAGTHQQRRSKTAESTAWNPGKTKDHKYYVLFSIHKRDSYRISKNFFKKNMKNFYGNVNKILLISDKEPFIS
jgi:hypothetical protein